MRKCETKTGRNEMGTNRCLKESEIWMKYSSWIMKSTDMINTTLYTIKDNLWIGSWYWEIHPEYSIEIEIKRGKD